LQKSAARLGFIGTGKVGSALAACLTDAGYQVVAVASRGDESARRLAAALPGCVAVSPQGVADRADLVFIATPDASIPEVVAPIRWHPGQAVVHTSGAESLAALAPAAGALLGSFHPLQTFADAAQARLNLPGSLFAIEAEGELRDFLSEIAAALDGVPIFLRAEDRAFYHAAAVLVSNYTVVLTKVATDLWLRLGVDRQTALQGLLPLLRGTVNNIESLGLPAALTGPIARGDVATVRRHLEALQEAAPELIPLYAELGMQTIPVALAKGGLEDGAARELRELFFSYQESVKPGGATPV
jgi:predicted short-subunit dehydrogenase-like oxidoreductase (DUF2520 family)